MTKFVIVLAALFLLPIFAGRTDACSCGSGETVCGAYQGATAVFIGIPLSDAPVTSQREVYALGKGKETITYSEKLYRFTVEQSFKGVEGGEIEVQTGMGGGDCGYSFKKGERYLVYAYLDSKTNRYHTSICTRTASLSRASEDLDFLRGLPDSMTKTRISGTITQETNELDKAGYGQFQRMSGVKVVLKGEKTFEAVTNEEGVFLFVGVPPGRYTVKPELPVTLAIKEEEINVPVSGCATLTIYTKTDGRISGRVVDNQGRIVEGARVALVPADIAKDESRTSVVLRSHSEKTDKEGRYEFKKLKPGKYHVGINLNEDPNADSPYPRTYYSGTPDQEKATLIVLGDGEKLAGYDIVLPPAIPVRTFEGVFMWSDGRPVKPGHVSLKASADIKGLSRIYASADVDAQGHFVIKGFDGVECWIHGSTYSTVNGKMEFVDAEPVKILVNEGIQPIKLIAPVPKSTKGKQP